MDYLLFSVGVVAGFALLHRWLRRRGHLEKHPLRTWAGLIALLAIGGWYANFQEEAAYARVREMLEGFPPTYAQELERMGHARIALDTPPDDPGYLALIEAEKRWLKANPSVADIYTMRRRPDGQVVLVVDSETDYDHNGAIEGEREQRTKIGEVFEKEIPALDRALAGTAGFMDRPYSDRWGDWVSAFVPLRDASGRVEAVCGVDYPAARWFAARDHARRPAMAIVLVIAVVFAAARAIIALLQSDLRRRTLEEARISALNAELEARVVARTTELEATHRDLVTASHRAGMAEVATNVLHNVGNVLSSVNTSAGLLADEARALKAESIERLVEMLRGHRENLAEFFATDPRSQKVLPFLEQIAVYLGGKRTALLREIDNLRKAADHMRAVVQMQQGFARTRGMEEVVDVATLVEDCVTLSADLIRKHGVRIERRIECRASLSVEKHKVMQSLVNLIRNACQACAQAGQAEKIVTVFTVEREGEIEIGVSDNGVGIPPEVLQQLFKHGFSTRKDGHGFGLHSAAQALQELGGRLTASSAGAGKGATFHLILPYAGDRAENQELVAAAGAAYA